MVFKKVSLANPELNQDPNFLRNNKCQNEGMTSKSSKTNAMRLKKKKKEIMPPLIFSGNLVINSTFYST